MSVQVTLFEGLWQWSSMPSGGPTKDELPSKCPPLQKTPGHFSA